MTKWGRDTAPTFWARNGLRWPEGLGRIGVKTLYIEPGSPWENDYCESLNSKLRDELLNGEIFTTLREAEVLIENWRKHYNAIRPHSSLNYRPPAPEAVLPPASCPTLRFGQLSLRAEEGRYHSRATDLYSSGRLGTQVAFHKYLTIRYCSS